MTDDLYHEEREELRLLDCMLKSFKTVTHIKSKCEATGGNYDYKGKHHRMLAQTTTSLNYVLYWMATLQSLTTKELAKNSNYKAKSADDYLEALPPKGYQLELIDTPHGLYEGYLRMYKDLELCLRINRETIDRLPKGNDLVVCLIDSLQDAGKFLEEIL